MSRKAERILERMRNNKKGWYPKDFHTLYLGFGFIMKNGRNHDIFIHPDFNHIRDTIPRHPTELGPGYAKDAVKNIDLLIKLQNEGREDAE
jgi:predicted RNA binding protein YcfA (HicA-like mRNA interferase family)